MVYLFSAARCGVSPVAERGKIFSHNGKGGPACLSSSGMTRREPHRGNIKARGAKPSRALIKHYERPFASEERVLVHLLEARPPPVDLGLHRGAPRLAVGVGPVAGLP